MPGRPRLCLSGGPVGESYSNVVVHTPSGGGPTASGPGEWYASGMPGQLRRRGRACALRRERVVLVGFFCATPLFFLFLFFSFGGWRAVPVQAAFHSGDLQGPPVGLFHRLVRFRDCRGLRRERQQ